MKVSSIFFLATAMTVSMLTTACTRSTTAKTATGDPLDILAAHKTADQFGLNGIREMPEAGGHVLFANPMSRFELPLDSAVKSVSFSFGIVGTAVVANPPTQGVDFRLILKRGSGQESVVWSKKLNPVADAADRGLKQATVPVSGSDSDKLIFETLALQNPMTCWAFWKGLTVIR